MYNFFEKVTESETALVPNVLIGNAYMSFRSREVFIPCYNGVFTPKLELGNKKIYKKNQMQVTASERSSSHCLPTKR